MLFKSVADSLCEFSIVRDSSLCIRCAVCTGQCTYGVHSYHSGLDRIIHNNSLCAGCRRCEAMCPTGAIAVLANSTAKDSSGRSFKSQKLDIFFDEYETYCSCWDKICILEETTILPPTTDTSRSQQTPSTKTIGNVINGTGLTSSPVFLSLSGVCAENLNLRKAVYNCALNLGLVCDLHPSLAIEEFKCNAPEINVLGYADSLRFLNKKEVINFGVRLESSSASAGIEQAVFLVENGVRVIFLGCKVFTGLSASSFISRLHEKLKILGLREKCFIVAEGCVSDGNDVLKALLLGADALNLEFQVLKSVGCTACKGCAQGLCAWGIATAAPELYKRLNPALAAAGIEEMIKQLLSPLAIFMGKHGFESVDQIKGRSDFLSFTDGSDFESGELDLKDVRNHGGQR